MAFRMPQKQQEHDVVLAEIVEKRWNGVDGRVYSNPDGEKNCWVSCNGTEVYPDIVVLERNANIVRNLGEVETAETVTEDELRQWKLYVKIVGECYLYVPSGTEQKARELVRGLRGFDFGGTTSDLLEL